MLYTDKPGSGKKCNGYSSGGMGKAVMYHRLTNLLSDKWNSSYFDYGLAPMFSQFLPVTFLIDVYIHSSSGSPGVPAAVDLVVAEGHLATSGEQ